MLTAFTEINRIFSDALKASEPTSESLATQPITEQEIKDFFQWFAHR